MLNDSWQMVAIADRFPDLPPIPPQRLIFHDIFAFLICLGGVLLVVFKNHSVTIYGPAGEALDDGTADEFSQAALTSKAVWFLAAVWYVLTYNYLKAMVLTD